jgi:hypothetical protein
MNDNAEQVVIENGRMKMHNGYYIMYNPTTNQYRAEPERNVANDAFNEMRRVEFSTPLSTEMLISLTQNAAPLHSPGGMAIRPQDRLLMMQQSESTKTKTFNQHIEEFNTEVDNIASAIQAYSANSTAKQDTIRKNNVLLEQLYTRLQELPEDGMSEQFKQRITDMKVTVLKKMQEAEKNIPKMSLSERPAAVKALSSKEYTDDELRLFVAASDVLRSYEQIQDVYFDKLSSFQQQAISDFILTVINPLFEQTIGKDRFAKESLTMNALCKDLIAQIVGITDSEEMEMNLPDNGLEQQLLANTLVRVITEVRPIGDSIQLTLESTTPKDIGKAVVTGTSLIAAMNTLPTETSLVAQISQGVASGLGKSAPLVAQYPLQAYATIYHLVSYITGKYEEQQLNKPDFVFKRLLNDLQNNMHKQRMEKIFGQQQPVLGWYDYSAILKNTLIKFGNTACGQVERAVGMFNTTRQLPEKTAKLCSRVGMAVQTYLHDAANRMAARPYIGMNPALFSKCADVMKDLLDTEEYSTLADSEWVKSCLDRMGLLDTQKELTFQKVLRHEATDVLTHGIGVQHIPPGESQEALLYSQSSQDSLPDAPVVNYNSSIRGEHGELLEDRDRPGAPQGTGESHVGFKNVAAAAAAKNDNGQGTKRKRDGEGGAKITKHRKSRSNIKRQSKKLKRKSRRYQRRASSRKGRK